MGAIGSHVGATIRAKELYSSRDRYSNLGGYDKEFKESAVGSNLLLSKCILGSYD